MATKIKRIYLGDKMLPRIYQGNITGSVYSGDFEPSDISGLGAWFDATDLSTLSQTSDGSTPVMTDDDPVGYWKCKVTGAALTQTIDANRPLWKSVSDVGSKPGLALDGNKYLFATSGELMEVARNVSGVTVFAVIRVANTITSAWWQISVGAGTNQYRGRILGRYFGGFGVGGRRLDSDVFAPLTGSALSVPTTYIFRNTVDYQNTDNLMHINGSPYGSDLSFQTPGNSENTDSAYVMFGNQFLDDAFTILTTGLSGTFCEWIAYKRALTVSESARIEGYLAWKWGLQEQLPYDHPYASSFPGFGSQTLPSDPDALAYLSSVASADGVGVEVGVAKVIEDFIVGCKSDGIWDSIKASCILAGARTLNGALVPLAGTAPTNNNFVTADYDRKTGLKGNGSNKSLDTNRPANADDQNYRHVSVWISEAATGSNDVYLGTVATNPTNIQHLSPTVTSFAVSGGTYRIRTTDVPGFVATKRENANKIITWMSGSGQEEDSISGTSTSQNLYILDRSVGSLASDGRVAFYSIGEALDLEKLDNRVSRFMAENKFFLNTGLSGKDYDIDTLNYINAGYENGGSIA